jgi:hypothetical protein
VKTFAKAVAVVLLVMAPATLVALDSRYHWFESRCRDAVADEDGCRHRLHRFEVVDGAAVCLCQAEEAR